MSFKVSIETALHALQALHTKNLSKKVFDSSLTPKTDFTDAVKNKEELIFRLPRGLISISDIL